MVVCLLAALAGPKTSSVSQVTNRKPRDMVAC